MMKFLSKYLTKLNATLHHTGAQQANESEEVAFTKAHAEPQSQRFSSAEIIDAIEWVAMLALIIFSISYFIHALTKPINLAQYQMIERYSQNNRYPDTQIYAKALILHNKANQYDYLRLMYKVQNEHGNIHFKRNESATH